MIICSQNITAHHLHLVLLRVNNGVLVQPQTVDDRDLFTTIRPQLPDAVLADQMAHDGLAAKLHVVAQLTDVHIDAVVLGRLEATHQALLLVVARVTLPSENTQANMALEVQLAGVRLHVAEPLGFGRFTRGRANDALLPYFARTFGDTLGPLELGTARVHFSSDVGW